MVEGHGERTGRDFAEVDVGQTINYGCKLKGPLRRKKLMVSEKLEERIEIIRNGRRIAVEW